MFVLNSIKKYNNAIQTNAFFQTGSELFNIEITLAK